MRRYITTSFKFQKFICFADNLLNFYLNNSQIALNIENN